MDGDERPRSNDPPDRATRADGYRADGYRAAVRLQDRSSRNLRILMAGLGLALGGAIALSVLGTDGPLPATGPSDGRAIRASSTPSATAEFLVAPTAIPRLAVLGAPLPRNPVPMNAGWLRWVDPVTGRLLGDTEPSDLADPNLTFADGQGNVLQVCAAFDPPGRVEILIIDICAWDARGTLRARSRLATLEADAVPSFTDLLPATPILLDGAVSRDGRYLWLATSVHRDAAWHVGVARVDLVDLAPAGSRELRVIPLLDESAEPPPGDVWWARFDTVIRPVLRASPDGSRLSLTMTATVQPGAPGGLLRQERVEFSSTLDPADQVDIVFPLGAPSDLACDASRAAWATPRHYLTVCGHLEPNGDLQPFVRIENPDDMTRDVAVGPVIPARDQSTDDSSWLVDVRRGMLYRWSYTHRTFALLEVASRAGATLTYEVGRTPQATAWPVPEAGDNLLPWTSLDGGTVPGWSSLRLAGSPDGTVVYAMSQAPTLQLGAARLQPTVLAIEARTGGVLGRWETPGPADQVAVGPGGGSLIELATPGQSTSGSAVDWTTPLWFVDPRTGTPLEVIGELRGPAFSAPTLLPAAVAAFAGF